MSGKALVEVMDRRLHVAVVGVPIEVDRLIGASEPGQVESYATVAGSEQRRHHLAPEIGPGRLAVEEDDGLPAALVDSSQSQAVPVEVARLLGELGEVGEALLGGAKGLHSHAETLDETSTPSGDVRWV